MPKKSFMTRCNLILILITVAFVLLAVRFRLIARRSEQYLEEETPLRNEYDAEIVELEKHVADLEAQLAGEKRSEKEE